jgi:CheY-like chemotaxis protein
MVKLGSRRDTLAGHMAPRRIESAQVERLVRQALDRVVNEDDRDTILRIALLNAGQRAIPKSPASLSVFVLGALRDAVVEFADADSGKSVVRALKPLLKMKSELELEVEDDEPASADAGTGHVSAGPTVIVVDSDMALRATMVGWLRGAGYQALAAPDAMVALAMSVRRRPDLLLVDVDEQRSAKQLEGLLGVAFGDEAPAIVGLASAVDEPHQARVLQKPVDRDQLLEAVNAVVPLDAGSPA